MLTLDAYFYQRWYDPQTATFASRAPFPPMMEHEYTFAAGNPVMMVDPDGRWAPDLEMHPDNPQNRGGRPAPTGSVNERDSDECDEEPQRCPPGWGVVYRCFRVLGGSNPAPIDPTISHSYWCCDGPNQHCFNNTFGVQAGEPYPMEASPTGNCNAHCVPADHKRYYCSGQATADDNYNLATNNCHHASERACVP